MIVVRLTGGLGNQMFQYAFGKMLAEKNNSKLKLDFTLLLERKPGEQFVYRDLDLDIFQFEPVFADPREIAFYNGYPSGSILQKAFFKISTIFRPRNLVIQQNHDFDYNHLNINDNSCIVGRWQSERYFLPIKEKILKDFKIKPEFLLNTEYESLIKNSENPVSVHVRRGDYISNEFYRNKIGPLDESFYQKAYKKIISKVHNASFFIFSEDIEWCKKNLSYIKNAKFISPLKSKKGTATDMFLISLCRHHIISNSTFSWWGAYLSLHEDKVVIAPAKWAKDKDFIPPYIHPSDWIIID